MEVERKFIIDKEKLNISNFTLLDFRQFMQSYLVIDTPSEWAEVRVRKSRSPNRKETEYLLTKKGAGSIARTEHNEEINLSYYNKLLKCGVIGRPIIKDRFTVKIMGLVTEIDVYHNELEGLAIAEIEFDYTSDLDIQTAKDFMLPKALQDIVVREVTSDHRYKNRELAINGYPDR